MATVSEPRAVHQPGPTAPPFRLRDGRPLSFEPVTPAARDLIVRALARVSPAYRPSRAGAASSPSVTSCRRPSSTL
jgi:hypothetical protein